MTSPEGKRHPRRRWVTVGAVVGALALVGAACGDDDSGSADPSDATEATTDAAAFCAAGPAIDALFAADEPSPEDIRAGVDELLATAPDEIADDVQTFADAATVDGDPTEDPAFFTSYEAISDARIESCGYQEVAFDAVDYGYEGIPNSIEAGDTAFKMTNVAPEEFHIGVIFRVNDDTTESLDELLALPEEEVMGKVTEVTETFAPPGATMTAFADDLESGRYAIVCFIPVGGGEDGPPHFVEGMAAEFEVT